MPDGLAVGDATGVPGFPNAGAEVAGADPVADAVGEVDGLLAGLAVAGAEGVVPDGEAEAVGVPEAVGLVVESAVGGWQSLESPSSDGSTGSQSPSFLAPIGPGETVGLGEAEGLGEALGLGEGAGLAVVGEGDAVGVVAVAVGVVAAGVVAAAAGSVGTTKSRSGVTRVGSRESKASPEYL